VNYGPRSILLHLYYHQLQTLFTFRKHYFTSLQTNISFHTICLVLCFQQTSEIDNLTASWGKVVWLCCVQVPRCSWHQGSLVNHALDYFRAPCQSQLATTFRSGSFSYWSIKLWFHTEGKLTAMIIIPSSWGFPMGPLRHHFTWRSILFGRDLLLRGASWGIGGGNGVSIMKDN
jgi:hypothetical protein